METDISVNICCDVHTLNTGMRLPHLIVFIVVVQILTLPGTRGTWMRRQCVKYMRLYSIAFTNHSCILGAAVCHQAASCLDLYLRHLFRYEFTNHTSMIRKFIFKKNHLCEPVWSPRTYNNSSTHTVILQVTTESRAWIQYICIAL